MHHYDLLAQPGGVPVAQGGQAGLTCRVSLVRNGANVEIDGKSNLVLQRDDLVTIESCGGGGYGAANEVSR